MVLYQFIAVLLAEDGEHRTIRRNIDKARYPFPARDKIKFCVVIIAADNVPAVKTKNTMIPAK
jgi:hypothetical protein